MKTSGLFTVHGCTIPVRYNKPFRIVFFGDVHRDSPNHAHGKWQEFLKYAKSLKDAWFFGMGDYLDSTSTTERECLGNISPKMHETFRNDVCALQLAKCEQFAKEIQFMRGKIIGFLNGNHYFNFPSGINSDQKICELVGAKYLGVCGFVRLTMDDHGRRVTRDIFAHHGAGGARLIGGSLNRVQQIAEGVEADILCMGHDHKRGAVPAQPRLRLSNARGELRVEQRETVLLRSGSYLASYEPGQVNYNVDACRAPSSLGHVEIEITVRQTRAGKEEEIDVQMRTVV